MKKCYKCGKTKPKLDFYSNKARSDGLQGECKECSLQRQKTRLRLNRGEQDFYRHRKNRLTSFGVIESFDFLVDKQNGKCAICGKSDKLYIDHCHESNKYRGLLCFHCNTGLGKFFDSSSLLQNAIDYLDRARLKSG